MSSVLRICPLRNPSAPIPSSRLLCFGALAAAYGVFCLTYLPINAFSVGRPAHGLFLPGEAQLPFLPDFEFFYALGYVLPLAVVWRAPDRARLVRLVRAFVIALAVAYATYLSFPVYFERPHLEVHSLATRLLALEYRDRPYNHFPSLHVALGWLVYLACRDRPVIRGTLLPLISAMSISTIFVKQHYLVDALSGAALAGLAWWVAGRMTERRGPR